MDYEKYKHARRMILQCLHSRDKWGGAHTSIKHILKKIPPHARGSKEVKKAAADLIKEGKILLKKTIEDDHVSLNPRLLREIREELSKKDYSKNVYQSSKNKHLNR